MVKRSRLPKTSSGTRLGFLDIFRTPSLNDLELEMFADVPFINAFGEKLVWSQ